MMAGGSEERMAAKKYQQISQLPKKGIDHLTKIIKIKIKDKMPNGLNKGSY